MKPIHPLVLQCVPEISAFDREKLRAGIQEFGLIHPIVIYQDQVIDGRTRQELCGELGIPPRYQEYNDPCSIPEYILQCNLRRNLTQSQSDAMILALGREVIPQLREEAKQAKKEGQIAGGQVRTSLPRDSVASKRDRSKGSETQKRFRKLVGSTQKADAVLSVINHPDLSTAVEKQEMSLKDAHRQARKRRHKKPEPTPRTIEPFKGPSYEETGFPVNGTMAEKDAHHKKYGRTPLHSKAVKDMLDHDGSVGSFVMAIISFTNPIHPNAAAFLASIEAMSQWVPQPEKGKDYGINFAAKAKKHLAITRERLPELIKRVEELSLLLKENK